MVQGEEEVAAIGKALEKTFFFFLSFFVEREKLGRQNLLFPLCNVVGDIWGFFLSYFPASITLKWPASVGPECPVQPLTVYMVYTSVVV